MIIHESLKDIAKEIEATGKPKRMRVRRLLAIVGQERRGKNVTRAIRRLLRRHQLKCDPDFANVHIDSPVRLTLCPKVARSDRQAPLQDEEPVEPIESEHVSAAPYIEAVESHSALVEIDDETETEEEISKNGEAELDEEDEPTAESEEREVVVAGKSRTDINDRQRLQPACRSE